MKANPTVKVPILTLDEMRGLPELIGYKEAAAILNICPRQAQRMAANGTLPAVRVASCWRFNRRKVMAMAGLE